MLEPIGTHSSTSSPLRSIQHLFSSLLQSQFNMLPFNKYLLLLGGHKRHGMRGLHNALSLKVLVATIDAQWKGMGNVGSARYEPALLPPCPTIRVLTYSN